MGGDKAIVNLAGRPLLHYPLAALQMVVDEIAVVAKRDTALPRLPAVVPVWVEPDLPRHPLVGIAHALRMAAGRPVLVCAADLPLITPAVLRELLMADPGSASAVVPRSASGLEPLCALYLPKALPVLARFAPGARAIDVVSELGPAIIEVADISAFLNVNAPEDLLRASALMGSRT
jgi:molybdopterin-guanine dinucleotide biosynthesis protein A